MSDANWKRNDIQFTRLLAEIAMVAPSMDNLVDHLCESMDLSASQLYELFDRASKKWEKIKTDTDQDSCACCGAWGATDQGEEDDS